MPSANVGSISFLPDQLTLGRNCECIANSLTATLEEVSVHGYRLSEIVVSVSWSYEPFPIRLVGRSILVQACSNADKPGRPELTSFSQSVKALRLLSRVGRNECEVTLTCHKPTYKY